MGRPSTIPRAGRQTPAHLLWHSGRQRALLTGLQSITKKTKRTHLNHTIPLTNPQGLEDLCTRPCKASYTCPTLGVRTTHIHKFYGRMRLGCRQSYHPRHHHMQMCCLAGPMARRHLGGSCFKLQPLGQDHNQQSGARGDGFGNGSAWSTNLSLYVSRTLGATATSLLRLRGRIKDILLNWTSQPTSLDCSMCANSCARHLHSSQPTFQVSKIS